MKNGKFYIAYGSNMNKTQMARRCPHAIVVGTAIINDYELLFRGHEHSAVATIEPKKGSRVPVAVWFITPTDERSLDVYEGYPHLYIKQDFEIIVHGNRITAMAYIMTPGRKKGMPSDHYLGVIEDGYADFWIDTKPLLAAVKRGSRMSTANAKEVSAKAAVSEYAKRQMNELLPCPRCGRMSMKEKLSHNALSRRANIYICDGCGNDEAMRDFAGYVDDLTDWFAVKRL